MDNYLDQYLGRLFKNWAGRKQAPRVIRARVLSLAAQPPARGKSRDIDLVVQVNNCFPANWEHFLHTCDFVHSHQNGLTVTRILV